MLYFFLMEGSLIARGGPVMVPMIALSVVALAIVLNRLWVLWRIRLDTGRFADDLLRRLDADDERGALELCGGVCHPAGRVLAAGIRCRALPPESIERAMEREGEEQIGLLERHMTLLAVIVGIEPMLGFLGTITGLIRAFMSWERLGADITVNALAGGIYEAMITTAAGLIIAIPYYAAYHLISQRIRSQAQETSRVGDRLLDFLANSPGR